MTERAQNVKNALNSVQSLKLGFKNIVENANKLNRQVVVLQSISLYALNRQNVISMFGEKEDMNTGRIEVENEYLFEVLPDVALKQSIEVEEIRKSSHISCASSDRFWIRMWRRDTDTSIVSRFDRSGKQIQSFQYDEFGESLYKKVLYLTENQNSDIIVSDLWYGVVVVNREGKHRFSYKGPPSVRRLSPHGVCTDALLNMFVITTPVLFR
ncbi:uncharacterized protein LOC133176426 [Saccostrea echinata]|uniref:uncharacterized protein LOC133176426 n=1 Tax=Saccostrea echinata TaxID=191078 RepID=UPI002A80094C|nr:uncharacterized protein LOC133176426 [Saccostrea echinata]